MQLYIFIVNSILILKQLISLAFYFFIDLKMPDIFVSNTKSATDTSMCSSVQCKYCLDLLRNVSKKRTQLKAEPSLQFIGHSVRISITT